MADEISLEIRLAVAKAGLTVSMRPPKQLMDLAGTRLSHMVQTIGFAAAEAVALSADQSTAGIAYFRNADETNFLTLGITSAEPTYYPFVKLLPGEIYVMRLGTAAVYAQADTGACQLEYLILEP